jgi:hypothetical protein
MRRVPKANIADDVCEAKPSAGSRGHGDSTKEVDSGRRTGCYGLFSDAPHLIS